MLPFRNISDRYGWVAMLLHWSMAILILGLLGLGLYMSDLPKSPDKLKLYGLHKSFGMIVLALAVVRVYWRNTNYKPPLPESMLPIQRVAAYAAHYVLYILIVLMPLSGWLMSSAGGYSVSVFGLYMLPDLIEPDHVLHETFEEAHELLAYALMATLVAHIGAAFYHHFIKKDNILKRMLP